MYFHGMKMWTSVCGPFVLAAVLAGCPGSKVEEPEDNGSGRIGSPCTVDTDCAGGVCVGGSCAADLPDAGASSSSSSSTSSSSGGSSSSTMADAGPPDANIPVGVVATDPATGPIEFGAQRIGVSVEKTVIVSNIGQGSLAVVQIAFRYAAGSVNNNEFTYQVVGMQPSSLAPSEQFAIRVLHTPADGIPDHAFLSIVTTDVNQPLTELELVAEFKGNPALAVHDTPDATGSNITQLVVGASAVNDTITKDLYIRNVGAGDSAITITSITVEPATQTVFTLDSGPLPRGLSSFPGVCVDVGACGPTATDCVGGLCLITVGADTYARDAVHTVVSFTSALPTEATAELVITGQGGGQTFEHRVQLAAVAQAGRLIADPNPVAFGEVFLNRSAVQTVRLSNEGAGAVTVNSIDWQFALPEYAVDTSSIVFPRTVGPGGWVEVPVTFTPTSVGGFNNMLVAYTTAEDTNVQVTGVGGFEPEIVTPATLDFGNVYVGLNRQLSVSVDNNANGLLRINRAYVDAPAGTPYSFNPTVFPDPIQRNTPISIQVTYAPQALNPGAPDTADLVLESNDPDTPLARIALTGRTVRPVANVVPAPPVIDFGPVLVGTSPSPTRSVIVSNYGVGVMDVSSPLAVTGSGGSPVPQFVVTPTQGASSGGMSTTLAGGGASVTFNIQFTPTANSSLSATFRITTSDPMMPTIDVQLSGGGATCTPRSNATFQVIGNTCVYSCNSGYHECGATCLSNTSVNSCGSRCSPCDTRTGTSRSCSGGNCSYSCSSNRYDLNNDRNVAQGTFSNGCEYSCIYSGGEVCNAADDNCNGQTDEGLPADSPDPSSACASALNLGDVNDVDPGNPPNVNTYTGYTLYPVSDSADWFRFRAHEVSSCSVLSCWPWEDQTFEVVVTVDQIPAGEDYDLQVLSGSCSGTSRSSTAGGNNSESVTFRWKGGCGGTDNRNFYFRVYPYNNSFSCFPYRVRVSHRKQDCDDWNP